MAGIVLHHASMMQCSRLRQPGPAFEVTTISNIT